MGLFCATLSLVLLHMFKLQLKIACSRLSDSKDESRRGRRWREKGRESPRSSSPQFPHIFFRVRAFSISRIRLSRSPEQAKLKLAEKRFS